MKRIKSESSTSLLLRWISTLPIYTLRCCITQNFSTWVSWILFFRHALIWLANISMLTFVILSTLFLLHLFDNIFASLIPIVFNWFVFACVALFHEVHKLSIYINTTVVGSRSDKIVTSGTACFVWSRLSTFAFVGFKLGFSWDFAFPVLTGETVITSFCSTRVILYTLAIFASYSLLAVDWLAFIIWILLTSRTWIVETDFSATTFQETTRTCRLSHS